MPPQPSFAKENITPSPLSELKGTSLARPEIRCQGIFREIERERESSLITFFHHFVPQSIIHPLPHADFEKCAEGLDVPFQRHLALAYRLLMLPIYQDDGERQKGTPSEERRRQGKLFSDAPLPFPKRTP